MRYFGLMLLVSVCGLSTPALAQTCCPAGCVNQYPGGGCVTIGANPRSCNPVSCRTGTSGSTGGGGGGGSGGGQFPAEPHPQCYTSYPTQAARDAATGQCVSALSANAQFFGCWLEDDHGRAEDQRTGLSCPAREAALANQCRAFCSTYVANLTSCSDPNSVWQQVFGNIGGFSYGSARVDLCGPRLPTKLRPRPQRNFARPPL
jgi:hypothetical protein